MGQKTEFKLEDWAFPEEKNQETKGADDFLSIKIDDEFNKRNQEIEPLLEEVNELSMDAQDSKIYFSGKLGGSESELSQEELAFRRQIEDLFELLEMEKAADKSEGVRVYQTDSSPSRPWRFH